MRSGKISTRDGNLLAELIPTPKIIGQMRAYFPRARLVGWKFEVEGNREAVLQLARRQITESSTDACVANGPAYGAGFGLVRRDGRCLHLDEMDTLFEALEKLLRNEKPEGATA
jgi:phosphopantothenoylcysteine decarboxylase/phosphopantothenate--cysteine ligase